MVQEHGYCNHCYRYVHDEVTCREYRLLRAAEAWSRSPVLVRSCGLHSTVLEHVSHGRLPPSPPPPSLSLQKKAPVAPPSGKRKRDDAIESDAAPVSDGADNEDVVLDDEALRKLLDEADKVDVPVLDVLGVKQMLLSLEKKTNKNQELRMKFPGDPSK